MPRDKTPTPHRPFSITSLVLFSFLIFITPYTCLSQEAIEPFSIDVTVNYIDLYLETVGGTTYLAWWISDVDFGDTIGMEISEVVHLINGSNVQVDLYSTIVDYPDSTSSDTLWPIWEIAPFGGHDSVGFRWASEPALLIPPFEDAQIILSSSSFVESDIPEGENRYLIGWFLAPVEGETGESHRLRSNIMITPSMIP